LKLAHRGRRYLPRARAPVAEVAGHAIRPVHSSRFGRLFLVGETGRAFSKLAQAETHAKKHPKETPAPPRQRSRASLSLKQARRPR
jgi:hypothetical protein